MAEKTYSQPEELIYSQPPFDAPENEKGPDWFKQNIRYYTRFYNRPYTSMAFQSQDYRGQLNPVERGLQYMLYLIGKQQNIDYNYAIKDSTGNSLQSVWIPGKKVKSIVDYLLGNLNAQMNNKIISAMSLSKDAVNKKTRMFDDLMLQFDTKAKKILDELKKMGVEFDPSGGKEFESEDDVEKFIKYTWKDNAEITAVDIAKYIEESNDADTMYLNLFREYCAANYCGVHNYVENGRVIQRQVPFYNLLFDAIDNDPFNKKGRFVGEIERLTPQEVFLRFPKLTEAEREEIKNISSSDQYWNEVMRFYNTPNLNWYQYYQDMKLVSVVTVYWKGQRDLRYKRVVDKYDNVHYSKLKKNKDQGEYFTEDVYKGTLIGNRFLQNFGYAENTIRNRDNKSNVELPIKVFTDDTIMGDGVSPVGMIAQNQDRIDMYRYKIIEAVGRDSGKSYIINGNKLGEGVTSREILSDFKSMGIHVTPGTSGEDGDPSNAQRIIETIDLTLDPTVNYYLELIKEEERQMEEAMSVSKIAMGQQMRRVGKAEQQTSAQLSSRGLEVMYRNFMKFNELNLQYCINLAKTVYDEDDNFDAQFVIGERGIKYLQVTKEFKLEDLLLFIKVKDVIDEATRARLLTVAQALAQNGQIGMIEYLTIEEGESKSQLKKDIQYYLDKKSKEVAEQQKMMNEIEMRKEQMKNGTKGEVEALKQHAEDERTDKRLQVKTTEALLDHDARTHGK